MNARPGSSKVRAAVRAGVARWKDRLPARPDPAHLLASPKGPRASTLATLGRGVTWLFAAMAWVFGVALDAVTGKRGPAARADRAVSVLQRLGGTFVKMAQQLSLRADLLSPEWCDALGRLRDHAPTLAPDVARRVIEESTGRPLAAVFGSIDLEQPLGSASVACVYAATLPSGREVAVKVRRPDVARGMTADLALMRAGARASEFLGLASRQQATSFVEHLTTVLLDELDFTRELRNLESFQRSIEASDLDWLRVPEAFPERCSREVLTVERVRALPAARVLAAAEGDPAAVAEVRAAGIDPRRAGQRLFRAWNVQIFEFERFHGDPHPANLFVDRDDVLWLVDFGACGQFSPGARRVLRRIQVAVLGLDLTEMVHAALALIEPHPPIDMDIVARRLQRMYADYLGSVQSESAPWWEKATSRFWLAFIQVARDHGIAVNLDTLRLFRASFLMDTLAFRLDPHLDIREEYVWFFKREARRREERILRHGFRTGDGRSVVSLSTIEDTIQVAHRGLHRLERLLDQQTHSFGLAASKSASALADVIRMVQLLVLAAVGVGVVEWWGSGGPSSAADRDHDGRLQSHELLLDLLYGTETTGIDDVFGSPTFLVLALLIVWGGLRSVRGRLQDIDP